VGSFWVLLVIMLLVCPVMGKPALPGSFQTGLAVLADLFAATGVLVRESRIQCRRALPAAASAGTVASSAVPGVGGVPAELDLDLRHRALHQGQGGRQATLNGPCMQPPAPDLPTASKDQSDTTSTDDRINFQP
jgi:hypothetical protein